MTRVLITGANRGLGLVLARQLIARGDQVWGTARDPEAAALAALGPAGIVSMDLADEASIVAAVAAIAEQTAAIDLLVNCAGIDARAVGAPAAARGPFDLDGETFTQVTRINATGPMIVTREALPLLRAGIGSIVLNISSQLGSMVVGASMGNDTAYCVSKAALNMFTVKAAAALRAEGITVVAMHPGWVRTDMGGDAAPLSADESATSIISVVDGLTIADTGRFLKWDGSEHPW